MGDGRAQEGVGIIRDDRFRSPEYRDQGWKLLGIWERKRPAAQHAARVAPATVPGMPETEGGSAPAESTGLAAITARLERLAAELQGDLDDERAAELVREASELAARAGREVEQALSAASEARET